MPEKINHRIEARRKLASKFLELRTAGALTLRVLEGACEQAIDENDLTIQDYYQFRRYFIDRNIEFLSKEDLYVLGRSKSKTNKGRK